MLLSDMHQLEVSKDVCTLYVNGVITRGRLSVCEPASPSETCVSGVCMVP